MRPALWCGMLALTISTARADPWSALDRRRALLSHALPLQAADEGRAKPDEVGIYDLLSVAVDLELSRVELPEVLRFTARLTPSEALQAVPILAVSYEPTSVRVDGREAEFRFSAESFELLVFPAAPLPPGVPVIVEIEALRTYECRDDTGCAADGDLLHLADLGWYPLSADAPLTDRFLFQVNAFAPPALSVSATGARLAPPAGGRWTYQTELPTIAGALTVGTYARAEGELVELFVPPGSVDRGGLIGRVAAGALNYFSGLYVPYPFSRLGVAAIPDAANAAIGPQANIMLPRGLWSIAPDDIAAELVARVVAHEIAHQYFFNLVAVVDEPEAWLSEGWAEYSALRYSQARTGTDAHRRENYWGYLFRVPPNEDAPLWSAEVRQSPYYVEVVYLKGSVVVGMLAAQLGAERFDVLLREYVETFSGAVTTTPELEAFFADRVGAGLITPFFRQWIYQAGFPVITARASPARNDAAPVELTLDQAVDEPFTGPLPLRFRTAEGPVDVVGELRPGRYSFPIEGARGVLIDPELSLLRRVLVEPPGDVDLSGVVDGTDLLDVWALVGVAAPEEAYSDQVDVDGDGVIGPVDVDLVLDQFGRGW